MLDGRVTVRGYFLHEDSAVRRGPAGTLLTGGGASLLGAGRDLVLDDVAPSADLRSLRVDGFEDQDGTTANWTVTAHAICADQ